MSGMMGLSFFLHSFLLQMCAKHRKSSEPAIVKRDLGLAYFAACLMYVVIGATPAVVFELGSRIFANPLNSQLPQNILLVYEQSSVAALIGRIALTAQILFVYPILVSVIRVQFFNSVVGTDWLSYRWFILFNMSFLMFTTLITSIYPHPGNVVGYVGAFTAVVYVMALPMLVHIKALKSHGQLTKTTVVLNTVIFVIGTLLMLTQFI